MYDKISTTVDIGEFAVGIFIDSLSIPGHGLNFGHVLVYYK